MLKNSQAFGSFAVRDLDAARKFYGQTLGIQVSDVPGMKGILQLELAGGAKVLVYPNPDHAPANFTVLNFPVENVERTVEALKERGVKFEVYNDGPVETDARGISSGKDGPRIAWFRDPSGNILSVLEPK